MHFTICLFLEVIPVATSNPEIIPCFGAIYRILNLANEFEKSILIRINLQ